MSDNKPLSDVRQDIDGPPRGYFVLVPQRSDESIVDVGNLTRVLLRRWKLVLATGFLGGVIGAAISLQIPNTYRSTALISPVTQSGAGAASVLRNQLGGLAALAGIDLGASGGRKEESVGTLKSPGLVREFIVANGLLPVLAERRSGLLRKIWPGGEPPTLEDAVEWFTSDVLSITEDRKTGLITVTVDWYSPAIAAQWANGLVAMANEKLRAEAIRSSESSIEYLNKELAKTQVVEMRQAIYRVIESQVNTAMLANVQREYAFKVLDRAVPADPKHKQAPRRSVISLASAFVGGVAGMAFVMWRRRREWMKR